MKQPASIFKFEFLRSTKFALLVSFLVIILVKSTFIATYVFLSGTVVFQEVINNVVPTLKSGPLVFVLYFGLLLLYITNVIIIRLFTLVFIPKQVALVDRWLAERLLKKSFLARVVCQFILYSPLIFLFSSILKFFLWGEPLFFWLWLYPEQAMFMLPRGKVMVENMQSARPAIRNISTSKSSFGDHSKPFKSYIKFCSQVNEKENYNFRDFHKYLYCIALENKIKGTSVVNLEGGVEKFENLRNQMEIYRNSVQILINELNSVNTRGFYSNLIRELKDSPLQFCNKFLKFEFKSTNKSLDIFGKFIVNFDAKMHVIQEYVDQKATQRILTEFATKGGFVAIKEFQKLNPGYYKEIATDILLNHPIVVAAHCDTPSFVLKCGEKSDLTIIDFLTYELLFLERLTFDKKLTTCDTASLLVTIFNGSVVPMRSLIEFTVLYNSHSKILRLLPLEQLLLIYKAEAGLPEPERVRNNRISDYSTVTKSLDKSSRDANIYTKRVYDLKTKFQTMDIERSMADDTVDANSKVKLLRPDEKGYSVFMRPDLAGGTRKQLESFDEEKKRDL